MSTQSNLSIVLEYLQMMENRTSSEEFSRFYHEDVQQVEFPNTLTRNIAVRSLTDLKTGSEKGKQLLQKETYEVVKAYEVGNTVIIEAIWRGVLNIPLGNIPVGGEMKAYFGQFYEFENGKIIRQRNYDCFEPFV
jgi:ketosteroid isomerase-like protein